MKYSKSTGGFYSTEIHGTNIPADAVEITLAEHEALLAGQSSGLLIKADALGKPVLQSPPAKTQVELDKEASDKAKAALIAIDLASIRAIREWLVSQPTAPQLLKDRDAAAALERVKVKP